MAKLSATGVKNALPAEKSYKLADGGGLYLLVTTAGGKYWRYDYRFAGARKTLALGVYPEVSLKIDSTTDVPRLHQGEADFVLY